MTMRNKLIEAAARAMCAATGPNGFGTGHGMWEHLSEEGRSVWIALATAAVDTVLGLLMEPSEEMVEAGWNDTPADAPTIDEPEIKAIFQAMLGAIK